jgi:hypothetical protein
MQPRTTTSIDFAFRIYAPTGGMLVNGAQVPAGSRWSLPADLAAAHALILAQREHLTLVRSEVTVGRLEIERLKLMLAKARREQFGQSLERGKLLVEQLELAIEDLEETQAEQETKAEVAAPETAKQRGAKSSAAPTPAAGQPAGRTYRRTGALRVRQVRHRAAACLRMNGRFAPKPDLPQMWLLPSRPREFHPEPLTDPDVILSHHPARSID